MRYQSFTTCEKQRSNQLATQSSFGERSPVICEDSFGNKAPMRYPKARVYILGKTAHMLHEAEDVVDKQAGCSCLYMYTIQSLRP